MRECPVCNLCFDDDYNRCPHDDEYLITSNNCKTTLSGRYILEKKLGKGGMASVYKAKHKFLKSLHAIKIISPEVVKEDANLLVRFTQEAVLAASIRHPNVVTVTDFGVTNENTPYLVMEYIEGTCLDDILRKEKQFSPVKAFEVLTPITLGVGEAHSKGIVHRDLKPLNVMLKNGYPVDQAVKVLDFGLAKIKSSESFASIIQAKTTNILGSPHYMSPEQWANEEVDNRSDIYSLGIILYQMIAGNVPFRGDSIVNIMYQHINTPVPPLISFGISVSPQIEAVIQKALAKEQDQRYSTAAEFLSDYEKALLSTSNQIAKSSSEKTVSFFDSSLYEVTKDSEPKKDTGEIFGETYNLTYLNSVQNKTLATYFNQPKSAEAKGAEKLEEQFIYAHNRVEEARTKVSEAEKLAQEFNQAQKAAESARLKFLQAQQKLEEDIRRQLQAEMESKLVAEIEARKKAEAEARHLVEEAKARKEAEERANQLAKTALEAQQHAEAEHQKAEKEIQQRQLEEGTRRKAEEAALKLAVEVAEAKKKYEEARKAAEYEAYFRMEAEIKRRKVEEEIQRIALLEAEKRRLAEEEAARKIKEQAARLEQQAIEAEKKAEKARQLAESETQKREHAEAARKKAEEEARRLAEEIIEAQKRLEEAEQRAKSETKKRVQEEEARKKAEESARSLSAIRQSEENFKKLQSQNLHPFKSSSPIFMGETRSISPELSSEQVLSDTSSSDISHTNPALKSRKFNPLYILSGIFAFILISGFSGYLMYRLMLEPAKIENKSSDSNTITNSTQPPPLELPDRVIKKMVKIEGGVFQMGRDDVDPETEIYGIQSPKHTEKVTSFYIDRTEVSNEEYAEFVQAGYPSPKNWQAGKPVSGKENLPVTNVSYLDAIEFADWISKRNNIVCRLPTEQEWEYVARSGAKQYIYPWGNEWIDNRANIGTKILKEVGSMNDETETGKVEDMMGNVWEWTSTLFDYYPGYKGIKDTNFKQNNSRTARGSSFMAESDQVKNKHLLLTYRAGLSEKDKFDFLGFRLACYP